ncbi:IS3 family transposase [Nocardia sp. NPDC048505]|uniref:IS3 family transposase n=1 Tax=Nocardia sp. NPDC048505 TaxID=3155756 RepID=UPI0033D96879
MQVSVSYYAPARPGVSRPIPAEKLVMDWKVRVHHSDRNALMENFFSTLKTELVYRRTWRTRDETENALFASIDGWYKSQRIQKSWAGDHRMSSKPVTVNGFRPEPDNPLSPD